MSKMALNGKVISCATCCWYESSEKPVQGYMSGVCKRRSPACAGGLVQARAVWPSVDKCYWCGEWEEE